MLTEAGHIINDLLHEKIRRQSEKKVKQADPTFLDIDSYLQDVKPLLIQFITSATQTLRQRQNKKQGQCSDSVNNHVKKVRQYFILCQLLYCTNPQQPIPIHNILADVVEVCGGSRRLLKILNRLGCTSSSDTHDRFVTQHAEAARESTVWDKLPKNVFTIASVDNFDMLQSYSAVFCGDQTEVTMEQPYSLCSQAVFSFLFLMMINKISTIPRLQVCVQIMHMHVQVKTA